MENKKIIVGVLLVGAAIVVGVLIVYMAFVKNLYEPSALDELTFDQHYLDGGTCRRTCDENGENCHDVTTKEECEGIDDITLFGERIIDMVPDGVPDCRWIEEDSCPCQPNIG